MITKTTNIITDKRKALIFKAMLWLFIQSFLPFVTNSPNSFNVIYIMLRKFLANSIYINSVGLVFFIALQLINVIKNINTNIALINSNIVTGNTINTSNLLITDAIIGLAIVTFNMIEIIVLNTVNINILYRYRFLISLDVNPNAFIIPKFLLLSLIFIIIMFNIVIEQKAINTTINKLKNQELCIFQ